MLKSTAELIQYILLRVMIFIFKLIGFKLSMKVTKGVAILAWGVLPKVRKTTINNLKKAYPEKDDIFYKTIAKKSFINLVQVGASAPFVYTWSDKQFEENVKTIGVNEVTSSQAPIYLTGHFGNWEVLLLSLKKISTKAAFVYRKTNNKNVDNYITSLRQNAGLNGISKGPDGARDIVKAMRNGVAIGIVNDQYMSNGIETEFFGIKTKSAGALAEISKNITNR